MQKSEAKDKEKEKEKEKVNEKEKDKEKVKENEKEKEKEREKEKESAKVNPLKRKLADALVAKQQKNEKNEPSEVNKWWMDENPEKGDTEIKWDYLEHNGVLFPPFYKPHKVRINHKGDAVALNKEEEELATYWSQTIGTEWERKPIYRTNFSKNFLKLLGKTHPEIKHFDELDFAPIVNYLEKQRDIKRNRGPEERKVLYL